MTPARRARAFDGAALHGRLATLLGPGAAVGVADPARHPAALPEREARAVEGAAEIRRREFAAGRTAARRALAVLGHPDAVVPQGTDRAPLWPDGVVGSIAHCREVAVAVAAPVMRFAGVGIDVEPDQPLPADLWGGLFTETERAFLDRAPAPEAAAIRFFCAKEAAYKAHYPQARKVLEPIDVALRSAGDGRFEARFPDGASIAVRVGSVGGFVLAAATVPADGRKRSVSGEEKANSWQFRGKGDRTVAGVNDVARRPGA